MSGAEAVRLLGVKRQTLYAYASRGLVRSAPDPEARGPGRRYARADLERLRARALARSGHGAVAAGALRWGEPVLETAVSSLSPAGPSYRGVLAVDLVERSVAFERVAELLWSGELPETACWSGRGAPSARGPRSLGVAPEATPVSALLCVVPALAQLDPDRAGASPRAELSRARSLVVQMARHAALPRRLPAAGRNVAHTLARALGADDTVRAVDALNDALVLCAEHELNPSTFAARIAASAGADLYACVVAGLATLSGPKHGGACDRVEALLDEVVAIGDARPVVRDRARRGEDIPGFGHQLYPTGDPRAEPVLSRARRLSARHPAVRAAHALTRVMLDTRGELPTLDLGLVALSRAAGARRGGAAAIFALGRMAGWVAHVLEQRSAGFVVRPRARAIGAGAAEGRRLR